MASADLLVPAGPPRQCDKGAVTRVEDLQLPRQRTASPTCIAPSSVQLSRQTPCSGAGTAPTGARTAGHHPQRHHAGKAGHQWRNSRGRRRHPHRREQRGAAAEAVGGASHSQEPQQQPQQRQRVEQLAIELVPGGVERCTVHSGYWQGTCGTWQVWRTWLVVGGTRGVADVWLPSAVRVRASMVQKSAVGFAVENGGTHAQEATYWPVPPESPLNYVWRLVLLTCRQSRTPILC